MRAITCLLLGLAACATDKPTDAMRSTTGTGPMPVEAPGVELAASRTEAGEAQKYIGFRSPDLLFKAPNSLRPRGERIIDDTENYGLVVLGDAGGGELIFLDRRTDEDDFVVEAVLELPDATYDQVAWEHCELDGKPDTRIVALVAVGSTCDRANALVSAAWRVNPEAGRFDAISPDRVRCPAPICTYAGDTGGVLGGVVRD